MRPSLVRNTLIDQRQHHTDTGTDCYQSYHSWGGQAVNKSDRLDTQLRLISRPIVASEPFSLVHISNITLLSTWINLITKHLHGQPQTDQSRVSYLTHTNVPFFSIASIHFYAINSRLEHCEVSTRRDFALQLISKHTPEERSKHTRQKELPSAL